jgi:hypothetical protein
MTDPPPGLIPVPMNGAVLLLTERESTVPLGWRSGLRIGRAQWCPTIGPNFWPPISADRVSNF